jgi:formylglycine-generating enzyme required for sulfatase activity
MSRSIALTILLCVCVALPSAAQTLEPNSMVQIPAGKFWMGRTQGTYRDAVEKIQRYQIDDRPANLIELDAFYIDKYEVTNADYAKFIAATGARAPWHWPEGKLPDGQEKQAVTNVNWYEATAFCKWAGKRLPTEAEWEKAERGGLDRNLYSWGNDGNGIVTDPEKPAALPAAVNKDQAMAVGSFAPNGYGLYDMTGNVLEWVNDWYEMNYYAFMPQRNPQGPETGKYKSVRGGGWSDAKGERLTAYFRQYSDPELRGSTIGFRCVK